MMFYIYINTVSVKGTYFVFKTNKKRITNALIEDVKDKMLPYVKNIKNLSNETLKDFFISKFEKLEQNENTYNIIGDRFEKRNIPKEKIVFIEL